MTYNTEKRAVGRPRKLKNVITQNILISDEHIEAALKLNEASVSAAIRAALKKAENANTQKNQDFSKQAQANYFKNAKSRNIVLDEESQEIALRLGGNRNMSAGVRIALELLIEK